MAWTAALSVQAQSVNYVTEVITTYNGYWRSANAGTATTFTNSVQPDSSHYLLSFLTNNVRYSTGVSDARLTNNGISFTPGQYRALPVATISTAPTSNTKIGLGQLYDKVDNGVSNPPPVRDLARYLTDGPQGLDLGTGVANIPTGTLTFPVSEVQAKAINDGIPDILITQFADPAGSSDVYSFRDATDAIVGKSVTVTYDSNFPVVGRWLADFYEASQNPMVLAAGFTKTPRDLRLWTADFATFNIPASDYSRIATFQIQLSGNSDVAFVAYNTRALTVLPVELTSFNGRIQVDGQVQLTWRTASELNSEAFVVEASMDGRSFTPVGRVVAAGNKTTNTDYTYQHRPMTTGLVYYRLHQLDLDGRSAYSPVVTVSMSRATGQPLLITPNPFRQTLQLQLPSGAAHAEARLWAIDGRPLYQHLFRTDELGSGSATLDDLLILPTGIYLLEIVVDGRSTRQKLLKQE
ncbi:T9SS type A sorting domain-containing protein [Hymenobacter cavernae]|uniref:T9SS type A sorting domain-containing protein n=1 Tax=Hymenobacter cavernae TaxID=2044852 RepID=UPI00166427AA|nr:T9SS type A sorting domain-containing protein [Hymenobacter cavernae]